MRPIEASELLPNATYRAVREAYRAGIIEYKQNRRLELGPQVTFVFENRKTILFQLQEILRAEEIVEAEGIASEVSVYNALLPKKLGLSATVLIEFKGTESIREERKSFLGLMDRIELQLGSLKIPARFEEGRETEERISAVQYASFELGEAGRDALTLCEEPRLVSHHPGYEQVTKIGEEMRASLLADLTAI